MDYSNLVSPESAAFSAATMASLFTSRNATPKSERPSGLFSVLSPISFMDAHAERGVRSLFDSQNKFTATEENRPELYLSPEKYDLYNWVLDAKNDKTTLAPNGVQNLPTRWIDSSDVNTDEYVKRISQLYKGDPNFQWNHKPEHIGITNPSKNSGLAYFDQYNTRQPILAPETVAAMIARPKVPNEIYAHELGHKIIEENPPEGIPPMVRRLAKQILNIDIPESDFDRIKRMTDATSSIPNSHRKDQPSWRDAATIGSYIQKFGLH